MELRLYVFINYQLNSTQQNIQAGRAALNLVEKYTAKDNPFNVSIVKEHTDLVKLWASSKNLFTVVNAVCILELAKATSIISKSDFPWVIIREDKEDGNQHQMGVAVILPDCIFSANKKHHANNVIEYFEYVDKDEKRYAFMKGQPRFDLIKLIKTYQK
jgi:hypothetical protein